MSTCAGFASEPYRLIGSDGSPYSCKMRAVLRYRRIQHVWEHQALNYSFDVYEKYPDLKAKVIPILVRPDGTYAIDSTPLLKELDAAHAIRKVLPSDPAVNFLADVVEDFADEWGTKVMFEERFHSPQDAYFGAAWQVWQRPLGDGFDPETREKMIQMFAHRQRQRRDLIGSSNWQVMEHTLRFICKTIEKNLNDGNTFLFGDMPCQADFALYGQLRQGINDPLSSRVITEYPGAWGWVSMMDDLSGFEPPKGSSHRVTSAVQQLLSFATKTYFPFLLANAQVLTAGDKTKKTRVSILDGQHIHEQPAFPYQLKCLRELQRHYGALDASSRQKVDQFLAPSSLNLVARTSKL